MAEGARDPRRGSTARWVIGGLIVVLVAWLLVSGVVVWSARQHVNDGLDALERARTAIDESGLGGGGARSDLRAAKDAFGAASSLAGGPVLAPWRIMPLAGSNVRSVASLTSAAERVAEVGEKAAGRAREILHQHPSTGPERLAMLSDLAAVTRRAERSLRTVDLGPDFFLVGPLGDARERFVERFDQLRTSLANATAAAEGVERLMRGPRKYLVLAANNAEMRGGSGMMLSAGVATFENGEFSLGEMRPTPDFNLPAGAVTVPEDLQRLWGWTPIGQDWRWLGTSPRFDLNAPLAADMWNAATGERVDGVLAVDPIVVHALLDAQGPIEVDGRRLTKDDVVPFLLLDQYVFAAADPEQAARRDQLSNVARGAIDTLSSRAWNPDRLARTLSDAGRGRHVLAWSRDPIEERAWKGAGIGGDLHFNSLLVSILNTGGNKLDQFLEADARLTVTDRADRGRDATVSVRVRNVAPTSGLPAYVSGPYGGTDLVAGEYQGLVAVNTPGVGSLPQLEGLPSLLVAGRDGPTKVVAAGPLRLEPGETASVTVRFVLPEQLDQIVVEPSARTPAISWRFDGDRWRDTSPHTVDLG
ncbi:MAG TPA: DUF4012 domain-containing protein [Acidimicrobiia bacterium]